MTDQSELRRKQMLEQKRWAKTRSTVSALFQEFKKVLQDLDEFETVRNFSKYCLRSNSCRAWTTVHNDGLFDLLDAFQKQIPGEPAFEEFYRKCTQIRNNYAANRRKSPGRPSTKNMPRPKPKPSREDELVEAKDLSPSPPELPTIQEEDEEMEEAETPYFDAREESEQMLTNCQPPTDGFECDGLDLLFAAMQQCTPLVTNHDLMLCDNS
jgi:hypothetical protein